MKKIYLMILAISAFAASCSSPYYPEYVPIVSLGSSTSNLFCESEEGECSVRVISNVDYEATIISGHEWVSFADTDSATRICHRNTDLKFNYFRNNNVKRVAHVVLSADTRHDTIKIKQHGCYPEHFEIHDTSKEQFSLENGTRMVVDWDGGDVSFRLNASCADHQISTWTPDTSVISGFKVENKVVSFIVAQNNELQPRIVNFQVSYVDGWGDVQALKLSIRQEYNPDLDDEME